MSLTYRHRLAILQAEHSLQECTIHIFISVGIHRTSGTIECHGTSIGIEHSSLSNIVLHAIKWHDIACRRNPQRKICISGCREIFERNYLLMRELSCGTVSRIVHNQGSICLLLQDDFGSIRIAVAHRWRLTLISIPHHLFHLEIRILAGDILCHLVFVLHVQVVVTIITHIHDGVLPRASIFVLHIVDCLIDHHLGFIWGTDWETPYCHVLLFYGWIGTCAFRQNAHPTIADIAIQVTEWILALITEQIVVWRKSLTLRYQHTIVPNAITEE